MRTAPFKLIIGVVLLASCQSSPTQKDDSGADKAKPAITQPDSTVGHTTDGQQTATVTDGIKGVEEKELAIVDTLYQNEKAVAANTPGRYIFISNKGNAFEFTVAGVEDEQIEADESDADNRACDNTFFDGSNRMNVKTNASRAALKTNVNPTRLFETLRNNSQLESLLFPEDSREIIEQQNVEFKSVYIYGFSRQRDEDYHLIIGTGPSPSTSYFFNAEISAVPKETNSVGRKKIIKARQDFEDWFRINDQCRTGYKNNDWRRTPVPVLIRGSLFYDKQHAAAVHNLGPQSWPGIKIGSAWEIHPITEIVFAR